MKALWRELMSFAFLRAFAASYENTRFGLSPSPHPSRTLRPLRYLGKPCADKINIHAQVIELIRKRRRDLHLVDGVLDLFEHLKRLEDPNFPVDVGFVQTGVAKGHAIDNLVSLGSMFYEPLFIFYRSAKPYDTLSQFNGKRLAIGEDGAGTQVLALSGDPWDGSILSVTPLRSNIFAYRSALLRKRVPSSPLVMVIVLGGTEWKNQNTAKSMTRPKKARTPSDTTGPKPNISASICWSRETDFVVFIVSPINVPTAVECSFTFLSSTR